MNPFETLILLAWELSAIAAAMIIGARKGRRGTAFTLGLVLGWIGVIVIAFTRPTRARLVERERERLQVQREALG